MWFSIFRLKPFDNRVQLRIDMRMRRCWRQGSLTTRKMLDPRARRRGNQPQQRRYPDGYSSRSAWTGATLDARSAGSQ